MSMAELGYCSRGKKEYIRLKSCMRDVILLRFAIFEEVTTKIIVS